MEPVSFVAAVGIAVVTGFGSWVAAFYGAYWKKKGEQAATHEDLENVLKEVRSVTKTTEEIKADIASGLWDKQKRWELRRDATFETARAVSAVKDTLTVMHGILMTDKENVAKGRPPRLGKQGEAYLAFNKAADHLEQAFILVAITCGDAVRNKTGEFALFAREVAGAMGDGRPETFLERANELSARFADIAKAIRAEMGLKKET